MANVGPPLTQLGPLSTSGIWAIRVRLQTYGRLRENTLIAWGIDGKLRDYDLVKLSGREVCHGDRVLARAIVLQEYIQRPVQFEITPPTREAVEAWIKHAGLKSDEFLFLSRVHTPPHLSTRPYARIVSTRVKESA